MQLVPNVGKRAISQRFSPLIGRGAFLPTIDSMKKHVRSDWIAGARYTWLLSLLGVFS